jgi:hypothetical protein
MSITPTAIIHSASPRPYAGIHGASLSAPTWSTTTLQDSPVGHHWVCGDHMSTEHNPVTVDTFGSKRLDPGSFTGVLT